MFWRKKNKKSEIKRESQEKINKKNKLDEVFEKNKTHIDPFGRKTTIGEAVVDYIVPKSKGGTGNLKNLVVMNKKSSEEKGEKMSGTMENGATFKVNRSSVSGSYGTLSVKLNKKRKK